MTAERIANAIMQDSSFKGYYLIVEGKKDFKLYRKFINEKEVSIKPAFGNEKVKKVLQILENRGFEKRIGIIDSDFKKILKIEENLNGLFITDDHDIEVMMIKTKALDDVLNVYCTNKSIKDFERKSGMSIRTAVLSLGKEVGYLKYANNLYDLGLVFKPEKSDGKHIKYNNFVCDKTFCFLGKDKLIETVINYSRNKTQTAIDKVQVDKYFDKVNEQEIDLFQLVNGHDLSNFLYILMKKILKSNNKMLVDFNCVEDSLILAYDFTKFKETVLYSELKNWSLKQELVLFEE